MTLYKNKYRIEPDRCQFWDYSSPGSYFITVCVQNKEHLLGKIKNGQMILSDKGEIVAEFFLQLPSWHKRIILDEWIVMPNHFHCLIILGDFDFDNGGGVVDIFVEKIHEFSLQKYQPQQSITYDTQSRIPKFRDGAQKQKFLNHYRKIDNPTIDQIKQYRKLHRKMLIPKIIGKFQMQTSKHINLLNDTPGNKIWQTGYHDHIIRNNDEYQYIKYYIRNNPKNWEEDTFYS